MTHILHSEDLYDDFHSSRTYIDVVSSDENITIIMGFVSHDHNGKHCRKF